MGGWEEVPKKAGVLTGACSRFRHGFDAGPPAGGARALGTGPSFCCPQFPGEREGLEAIHLLGLGQKGGEAG